MGNTKKLIRKLRVELRDLPIPGWRSTSALNAFPHLFFNPYVASARVNERGKIGLELSEAAIPEDFDALFATQWKVWTHPRHVIWDLIYPAIEEGPDAEAHAITAATDRQLLEAFEDPTVRWLKVVDTDAGMVVGGALWKIFMTNPFRALITLPHTSWWPKGSDLKVLTNTLFEQFLFQRPKRMQVAHMC